MAYEVASALGAPLDVFVVRKLGVPGAVEVAMGAIARGGLVVLNDDVVPGVSAFSLASSRRSCPPTTAFRARRFSSSWSGTHTSY